MIPAVPASTPIRRAPGGCSRGFPAPAVPGPGAASPVRLSPETRGWLWGALGMVCFSLTPVATRSAVGALDPVLLSTARAAGAALLAAGFLVSRRAAWPRRADLGSLAVVALTTVLGFPLFLAWALRQLPAAHVSVGLALLPLATALGGVVRNRERPAATFWWATLAGSAAVTGFFLVRAGGHGAAAGAAAGPGWGDAALLAAVAAAGYGYAEGAVLSGRLGRGGEVICWALVLAAPLESGLAAACAWHQPGGWAHFARVPAGAWVGLAYVTVVSQFLGFFPWYRGLVLGGIARVGQIQLLQPFLSLAASGLLLGERLDGAMFLVAGAVGAAVFVGRRAPVRRAPRTPAPAVPEAPAAPAAAS